MIYSKEKCIEDIFTCIEEINATLPNDSKLEPKIDANLVSDDGIFDSLSLINFFVSLEELYKQKGFSLSLLDEDLIVDASGPYKNVESLAIYILSNLD